MRAGRVTNPSATGLQGVRWAAGVGFIQHSLPLASLDKQVALKSPRDSVNAAPLFGPAQVCRCLRTGPTPEKSVGSFLPSSWFLPGHCIRPAEGTPRTGRRRWGWGCSASRQAGQAQPSLRSDIAFLCFLLLPLPGIGVRASGISG